MNLSAVFLVCLVGLVGCAALVFAVETVVAFFLHEEEPPAGPGEVITFDLRPAQVRRHDLTSGRKAA